MRIRLIIFDLGGVLLHVEPERIIEALAQDTKQPRQLIEQVVNDPHLLEPFELGHVGPKQFFNGLKTRLGLDWGFEAFLMAWNGILREKTETTGLLQELRSRYLLAVLSNTNTLHDEHIRRTWPAFSYFHHWMASYQVGLRKPDPQIYRLLLRQTDVPPHAAIYLDDIEEHVVTARRLGLTAIHFTDGLELGQELRAVGLQV